MMGIQSIVFWQNFISPHQSDFITEVARHFPKTRLVVEKHVDQERLNMGWSLPLIEQLPIEIEPNVQRIDSIVTSDRDTTLHVFPFTRAYPVLWNAMNTAVRSNARICLYSEYFDHAGLKGLIRRMRNQFDAMRYRRSIAFILGIGRHGVRNYESMGFDREKIFEFGYFVSGPESIPLSEHPGRSFDICYVGRLIRSKGIDTLLRAIAAVSDHLNLCLVGSGPEESEILDLIAKLGLSARVTMTGRLTRTEALARIRSSDLLVLPSKEKEGWGVVVNEALLAGVPVVCSDTCGAAVLFNDRRNGEIFSAGDVQSLTACIVREIHLQSLEPERKTKIRDWAKATIAPEAGAWYFSRIVKHVFDGGPRPFSPWANGKCVSL